MCSTPRPGRIAPRGQLSSLCSSPCGRWPVPATPTRRCCRHEVEDAMAMYVARLHPLLRSGRAHRPVLDGAHPAGEDRAQAAPSAVRGDPHVVPAVARRSAGCSGRSPGCGRTPSRSATSWPTAPTSIPTTSRSTASRSRKTPPPTSGSAWPRSKGAACRPVSSKPFAPTWPLLESRLAASDGSERGELMEAHPARHLLVSSSG